MVQAAVSEPALAAADESDHVFWSLLSEAAVDYVAFDPDDPALFPLVVEVVAASLAELQDRPGNCGAAGYESFGTSGPRPLPRVAALSVNFPCLLPARLSCSRTLLCLAMTMSTVLASLAKGLL